MNAPERHRSTWRFVVAYHGGRFAGWQKQEATRTVQGTLEAALTRLAGEPVLTRAAGRTDSGVHARGQLVSSTFTSRVSPEKMVLALGSLLPDDMSVLEAAIVDEKFDAKGTSIGKRYVYRVHAAVPRDPFLGPFRWHVRGPVDVDKMRRAAPALVGELDYESFRSAQCDASHARRCLWMVDVKATLPLIEIEVRGNAFCRNMVRIMAGTLVDIGRGRFDVDSIPAMLQARDRKAAGITAPPEGLTLEEVYLPEDGARAGIPVGVVFPGWPPAPAAVAGSADG
ncbi:MAG: tRNA pseudouridine(38-40) synthase TruA [Deltaproteobacteria bacterium]|nr:tRNA pseudouridine(38-40) synthase TruA [Deltaproteobacteria bacterium]